VVVVRLPSSTPVHHDVSLVIRSLGIVWDVLLRPKYRSRSPCDVDGPHRSPLNPLPAGYQPVMMECVIDGINDTCINVHFEIVVCVSVLIQASAEFNSVMDQ
jgi:hypothetical protein